MTIDCDKHQKAKIDLKDIICGQVEFGELERVLYSTDASLFKIKPFGIVIPKNIEDVTETVKYCRREGIPITPRGSGSGLAGSAINTGIIIDFVPFMNSILKVNILEQTSTVQPGVFQTYLNNELSKNGLFFPPNPSSADYCTIGGMIACNSSGGKSVKYGSTKRYVESLTLVLFNGDVVKTRKYREDDPDFITFINEESEWSRINKEVYHLCLENKKTILDYTPDVAKNCSGYDLKETLINGVFDINKVITGSEGTLGIIVEAVLGLAPIPEKKQSAMLFFDTLELGGKGVIEILKFQPSTCEIMAEDFIRLVKEDRPEVADFMPDKVGTALLLEFEGQSEKELTQQMNACIDHLMKKQLLLNVKIAVDKSDQEKLWSMRKAALPIIYNRPGLTAPVTFVEDCTVKPEKLPLYLNGINKIFKYHEVDSTAYGHAGDGNIHTRPLMDLRKTADVDKLQMIAEDVYKLAHSLGASFSGEHGDGILRSQFLPDLFGPLYKVFKQLKKIFDPEKFINPGKILNENKSMFIEYHRMGGGKYSINTTDTKIDKKEVIHNLEKCHGCGQCRTFCPVVLAVNKENALPRAKINLARSVIYGDIKSVNFLTSIEFKKTLDLCYNCKTCFYECPTHVDTGLVMQHLKNNYYEKRGHTLSEAIISNAEWLGKTAVLFNPLSNFVLRKKPLRVLMKSAIGLSSEIPLPLYANNQLKHHRNKQVYDKPVGKIAFFTGCTAKYNTRGEGDAFLSIIEHLGYKVTIPKQICCGLAKLGLGNYKGSLKSIKYNTKQFTKVLGEGYTPVTTCPSCHFMMSEGAASILENEEVINLGKRFKEATDFIWKLLEKNDLTLDFKPIKRKIAYKNPCHARETGINTKKLLEQIPGIEIAAFFDDCCGMGGTYGMKSKYDKKAQIISAPMKKVLTGAGADTQCTSCGACSIQVEKSTGQNAVHPLVLIKESLGLL